MVCRYAFHRNLYVYSFLLIFFSVAYGIHEDTKLESRLFARSELLHKVIFIWEDMRALMHAFNADSDEYALCDTIADKLMTLHEAIMGYIVDHEYTEGVEDFCKQTVMDIVYHAHTLAEHASSKMSTQLYADAQQLYNAINSHIFGNFQ